MPLQTGIGLIMLEKRWIDFGSMRKFIGGKDPGLNGLIGETRTLNSFMALQFREGIGTNFLGSKMLQGTGWRDNIKSWMIFGLSIMTYILLNNHLVLINALILSQTV